MHNRNIQKMEEMLLVSVPTHLLDSEVVNLRRDVLKGMRHHRSQWVLLDFSQVDVCDSFFGRFIYSVAEASRLMGAKVIVCGLQEAVAETLVEFDFHMPHVHAVLDFDDALEFSRWSRAQRRSDLDLETDVDWEQLMLGQDDHGDDEEFMLGQDDHGDDEELMLDDELGQA